MKKAGLFLLLFCSLAITSFSQTLFSYGKYKVDATEFLKAFNKNNSSVEKEKAAAIKALFESNGSKVDYRTYKSGFGTRGAFYMVAIAAKDAVDYASKIAENNKLLGEVWPKIYGDFQASLLEVEIIEGQMRPDMAYSPQ